MFFNSGVFLVAKIVCLISRWRKMPMTHVSAHCHAPPFFHSRKYMWRSKRIPCVAKASTPFVTCRNIPNGVFLDWRANPTAESLKQTLLNSMTHFPTRVAADIAMMFCSLCRYSRRDSDLGSCTNLWYRNYRKSKRVEPYMSARYVSSQKLRLFFAAIIGDLFLPSVCRQVALLWH